MAAADTVVAIMAVVTEDITEAIMADTDITAVMGAIMDTMVGVGMVVMGGVVEATAGELAQDLGSRHRAAVGMSQESDAVVVVVSEETGDISVAEHGRLMRKLTPEALRWLLRELLGRGPKEEAAEKAAASA